MRTFIIETLEEWNKLAARLQEKVYHPWQYQYGYWIPEGLHVWFGKQGKEDVEIVTHNKEVSEAILKYKRT